jgi:hypothetical protein
MDKSEKALAAAASEGSNQNLDYSYYSEYETYRQDEAEAQRNGSNLEAIVPEFTFANLTQGDFLSGRVWAELAKKDEFERPIIFHDLIAPRARAFGITKADAQKAISVAVKARKEDGKQMRAAAKAAKMKAIEMAGGIDVGGLFLEPDRKALDRPANTIENYSRIIERDAALNGIAYNRLKRAIDIRRNDFPWERDGVGWTDADLEGMRAYIQKTYGILGRADLNTALVTVSMKRKFHPVIEYLEALPQWDGKPRSETALIEYMGAEDTRYVRAATRKWALTCVARVYRPGTPNKSMLTLDGPQSAGKSLFLQRIAVDPNWFTASLTLADMKDKTAPEKIQGFWIAEIPDMAGMNRADVDCVKAFVSSTCDNYRPSYGYNVESRPRQCTISISVNGEDGYLKDTTGNTRFWPVKVKGKDDRGKHPWDMTREYVDQFWAEALFHHRQGESLLFTPELERDAEAAQDDAMIKDERASMVESYLNGWGVADPKLDAVGMEIWTECLKGSPEKFNRGEQMIVSGIMRRLPGWKKTNLINRCGLRVRGWKREPESRGGYNRQADDSSNTY